MNMGQLLHVMRANFLIDACGLHKVEGKPFMVGEIVAEITRLLSDGKES